MTDVQKRVAKELRRAKEQARQQALPADERKTGVPPPAAGRESRPAPREALPPPGPLTASPDGALVNESWRAEPQAPRGLGGLLVRLLERLLRPRFEAQQAFNANQVQLDNEILRNLEERSAATHRHYDQILGIYGRRIEEVDERHVILEEELVRHVEDLVRRIDLVLAESERGRLSLEHELRNLRRRLEELQSLLSRS